MVTATFGVTYIGENRMNQQQESTSAEAVSTLVRIVRDELKQVSDDTVKQEFGRLQAAWGSQELFSGTMEELQPILSRNLERICEESGFRYFVMYCDSAEGNAGVMASFPQTMVPVRLWKTSSSLYLCGNSLFTRGTVSHTRAPTVDSALCWAAYDGDVDRVKSWIGQGADVNARTNGTTPLIEAAEMNEFTKRKTATAVLAISEALLAAGADVNAKSDTDTTALHNAIEANLTDVAAFLIDRGADANALTEVSSCFAGARPLARAIRKGNAAIVQLLLATGARIDSRAIDWINYYRRQVQTMPEIVTILEAASSQAETPQIRKVIERWSRPWWQFWK